MAALIPPILSDARGVNKSLLSCVIFASIQTWGYARFLAHTAICNFTFLKYLLSESALQ